MTRILSFTTSLLSAAAIVSAQSINTAPCLTACVVQYIQTTPCLKTTGLDVSCICSDNSSSAFKTFTSCLQQSSCNSAQIQSFQGELASSCTQWATGLNSIASQTSLATGTATRTATTTSGTASATTSVSRTSSGTTISSGTTRSSGTTIISSSSGSTSASATPNAADLLNVNQEAIGALLVAALAALA